ncbi:uncharacterized protein B0T15DRAFT_576066 [Chaetomium strumarium]|uniref:C2H2-type domain-containing protein n=1 Tax=Chaetomium strumarium TaxID=1170767 RepID=A0AAJ0GR82_9PEZI|nr:hypothetical protein B0T15DRAFT_576066 [Chaetomium strumarium]
MPSQRKIRRRDFSYAPKCRFCPVASCNQLCSTRRGLVRHLVAKHRYTDAAAKVKVDLNNDDTSDTANTNIGSGRGVSTTTTTSSPSATGAGPKFKRSNARTKQCRQCRSLTGHASRENLQKFHHGDEAGNNNHLLKTVTRRRELRCQTGDCGAWFARPTELAQHWIRFHTEVGVGGAGAGEDAG